MPSIYRKNIKFHFKKNNNNDYVIVLDSPLLFVVKDCVYIVETGYTSNGMSVPRCLWSFISPQFSPVTLHASVCHDWLYDNHVMTREEADAWYREALIECGYPSWKAWLVYRVVQQFGKSHW